MTTTFRTYIYPGSLFEEPGHARAVESRDVEAAVVAAPEGAMAFEFHDAEEAPDLGPDFDVRPVPKNRSKRYYIDGAVHTLGDIRRLSETEGNFDILLSNMEVNGHSHVIRTRRGNWQPFDPTNCEVVST